MDYSTYKFNREVLIIKDSKVRKFVTDCIRYVPEYFWIVPSSSSGKHHPKDEFCKGGTVLHTMRAVIVAEELSRAYFLGSKEHDYVLSAAIMHDFTKHGYPEDKGHTVSGHGSLWINIAENVVNRYDILMDKDYSTIARLIACHMGLFDIPYIFGQDKLSDIVHLADYIASRESIDIKI